MIERIEINGEVIWVIEEAIAEEVIGFMVLRGKARDINIGLGRDSQREVARVLNDYIMLGISIEKAVCTISLKLHGR